MLVDSLQKALRCVAVHTTCTFGLPHYISSRKHRFLWMPGSWPRRCVPLALALASRRVHIHLQLYPTLDIVHLMAGTNDKIIVLGYVRVEKIAYTTMLLTTTQSLADIVMLVNGSTSPHPFPHPSASPHNY